MQIVQESDEIRLVAEEDFLVSHADSLQKQLVAWAQSIETGTNGSASKKVVLDLRKTSLMDSIGLKLVIGLATTCKQKGLPFHLEIASPTIVKLFQICRLNELLDIRETAAL